MVDPDEVCERTELTIKSCAHCRENGTYNPEEQGLSLGKEGKLGLSMRLGPELSIGLDDDGSIWIGPDEAFQRGRFGRGRYLFW